MWQLSWFDPDLRKLLFSDFEELFQYIKISLRGKFEIEKIQVYTKPETGKAGKKDLSQGLPEPLSR